MSTDSYDEILRRAQDELTAEKQQKLADELSQRTGRKNGDQRHSILELEGLGKKLWQGIDRDKYVAEERDSWDR